MARSTRRLLVLIALGMVLAVGTVLYMRYLATFRFWFPIPVGEGPAGPSVPKTAFDHVWHEGPVKLLGLGDSVTAGFGASPGLSYFERLESNPPDEFDDMAGINLRAVFPNLVAENLAVSGSNSIEHWDEQIAALSPADSDTLGIVVMTTGGNDLIHWYGRGTPKEGAMYGASWDEAQPWIDAFRSRLDDMVEAIEKAFPGGCHIFLANIYDPSDGVGNPAAAGLPPWADFPRIHDAYNEIIADCAAKHEYVHLVDMRSAFLGHGVHCIQFWRTHYRKNDPHYWYFDNLEDPNDRGYDAIRRLFLLAMADVLSPSVRKQAAAFGMALSEACVLPCPLAGRSPDPTIAGCRLS